MALIPKLEIRQGQALVMTPQLQQAIKLLQLSALDLSAYVDTELERNPLLERIEDEVDYDDPATSSPGTEPPEASGDNAGTDTGQSDRTNSQSREEAAGERDAAPINLDAPSDPTQLDTGLENVYADEARADRQARSSASGEADSGWALVRSGAGNGGALPSTNFETQLSREKTISDHLSEQLTLAISDPRQRMIGRHLIDLVDETGYITGDISPVAKRLGCTLDALEQVLLQMQAFEPTGVMARNLAECLAIQLREKDRLDPAMQALLDHIDLLGKHDFKALLSKCGISQEDLTDMIAEIRNLNPKPGLVFGSTVVQPVIPDVFVREHNDGSWIVELNTNTLPKVLVNQKYYTTVSGKAVSDKDKSYISECYADASWLVKSLDQRAKTILKTAREIVRQQDMFLVYGIEHLKPLNLKSIANAIEMHESTVSRVTANKYMATPRGVFELKYFFTSAIASSQGGDAHSAEAVRHRIKALIDDEAPDKILSDDKIVEILRITGIDIARRTVAKYREALRLPSSVQRRRQKRSGLLS